MNHRQAKCYRVNLRSHLMALRENPLMWLFQPRRYASYKKGIERLQGLLTEKD